MIKDYGTIKHLVRTAVRSESDVTKFYISKSKTQKHIRLTFVESDLYTDPLNKTNIDHDVIDRITKRLATYNAEVSLSDDWYIDGVQALRIIVIIPLDSLEN